MMGYLDYEDSRTCRKCGMPLSDIEGTVCLLCQNVPLKVKFDDEESDKPEPDEGDAVQSGSSE